jgi:hypothetical protein
MPKSALSHAGVTATISEAAEKLRDAGNQDLAGRLILAGASVSIGTDTSVAHALVASLAHECRAATVILQAALAVMTTKQQHDMARRVDAAGLLGKEGGTTRHFDRKELIARAESFLYVTKVPGVLH